MKRVAVFIDSTNVYHNLKALQKVDPLWIKDYDPLVLSQKLAGNRTLESVNFYCTMPPSLWQKGTKEERNNYARQMSYYSKIEKLDKTTVRYGELAGVPGNYREKNLDTQMVTDLILKATRNEYDVAIIVSNDGDFVSAVEGIKTLGRGVEVLYLRQMMSMNLKRVADITRRARRSYFVELK